MTEAWPNRGAEKANMSKWENGLASLGFTVKRINSYPAGLDDVRQNLPPMKRPFELSDLTTKEPFGEALYADLDGYRIVMQPPEGRSGFFAANVYDPAGQLRMSNNDYSAPEFLEALRRNIPALEDKIPENPAALLQDLFST